jgi:signal transduction histidine kinase
MMNYVVDQLDDPQGFVTRVMELYAHPELSSFDILNFKEGKIVERYSKPQHLGDRIVGRVWSFRDVTESKNNELALRLSRDGLERKVAERTDDLQAANLTLKAEKSRQEETIKKLADAQNQLLQSEKMAAIGQLAAGVAHEINNPVGFVSSNLTTLQRYVADLLKLLSTYEHSESGMPSEGLAEITSLKQEIDIAFLHEDVGKLLTESIEGLQRVKRIVLDLKNFSHVGDTTMQSSNLEQGMDSTINVVWNELKYKTEVVKEYAGIPEVNCIASQINQVFMNMLMNAAQAIETHGKITIRTGQLGEEVFISIADTGSGISAENLGHLFEPFFTTKPVGKGTGLGLSIAYGIVQKHQGRIEVKSEIDVGTTFCIWLPI